jgi:hypothetical protein
VLTQSAKNKYSGSLDFAQIIDEYLSMEAAVELEIKQKLSQLADPDLRSISAYLLRLRHSTEEARQERTRIMDEMDQGKKTPLSSLQAE